MEVVHYLRTCGRRRWLLVILPVVFASAGLPWALAQEPGAEGRATIQVQPLALAAGPATVRASVEAYAATVGTPAVAAAVSRKTGVPADDVAANVSAAGVETSNVVVVRYVGETRRDALRVTEAVALAALAEWLAPEVAALEEDVADAQKRYVAAREELEALSEDGQPLPPDAYRQQVTTVGLLKRTLATALREGVDRTQIAGIETELARAESELQVLKDEYLAYQRLSDAAGREATQVALARQQLDEARNRQVNAEATLGPVAVSVNSMRPLLVQVVLGGLALGVLVASLVLLIWELLDRRRSARSSVDVVDLLAGPPLSLRLSTAGGAPAQTDREVDLGSGTSPATRGTR